MRATISFQSVSAGLLAASVGFASSFAVILEGLTKVGADQAQAASGLMAAAIAMGLGGVILSLVTKKPISLAWSTPGAALLATSGAPPGGFNGAVGAFILSGVLILLTGLFRPFGRWVAAIPGPLANAMLAGVLFGLCLAPIRAVAAFPLPALAIIVTWVLVARMRRPLAVPAAVAMAAIMVVAISPSLDIAVDQIWPKPVVVEPSFSLAGAIGIAIPLFIVTMASQNIPGIAVLRVNGYTPHAGPLFSATGVLTLLATPFGAHAVNLAAITAAMCAGPDAHPDPARRYWAGAVSGAFYIVFGLLSGGAMAFIAAAPPILIEAVAGLALLGAFGSALMGAVNEAKDREAAVITFLVTASGVGFFGISGAFWGLVAGGAVMALTRWRARKPT